MHHNQNNNINCENNTVENLLTNVSVPPPVSISRLSANPLTRNNVYPSSKQQLTSPTAMTSLEQKHSPEQKHQNTTSSNKNSSVRSSSSSSSSFSETSSVNDTATSQDDSSSSSSEMDEIISIPVKDVDETRLASPRGIRNNNKINKGRIGKRLMFKKVDSIDSEEDGSTKKKKSSNRKKEKRKTDNSLSHLPSATPKQPASASTFKSSCGSLTLEGAASLSSDDSFQNSAVLPREHLVSPRGTRYKPKNGMQPRGSILKREGDDDNSQQPLESLQSPQQTPHSIQHYHKFGHKQQKRWDDKDDDSSSSSSGQVETEEEIVRKFIPKQGNAHNKRLSRDTGKKSQSKQQGRSQQKQKRGVSTDASQRNNNKKILENKNQSTASLQSDSGSVPENDFLIGSLERRRKTCKSDGNSGGKPGRETKKGKQQQEDDNIPEGGRTMTGSFSGSRNSNGLWASSQECGDLGNDCMDLSGWRSDDSSTDMQEEAPPKRSPKRKHKQPIKKNRARWHKAEWKSPFEFEEEEELPAPSSESKPDLFQFPDPQTTKSDGKPRSGYDKDADWYCGSDADDDIDGSLGTDGSSVLSLFRPKKKAPVVAGPPQSEASMDFGALIEGDERASSEALKTEETSMEFSFLDKNKTDSTLKIECEEPPDLEEEDESIKSVSVSDLMNNPIDPELFNAVENDVESAMDHASEADSPCDDYKSHQSSENSLPQESAPRDSTSRGDENHDKNEDESFLKKLASKRYIQLIAIGVASMIILDIVLLSVFLAGPTI